MIMFNLGIPKTFRECIELLLKNGLVSEELSGKLYAMMGLRNILVHQYTAMENSRLYEMLDQLDDLAEFVRVCTPLLQRGS